MMSMKHLPINTRLYTNVGSMRILRLQRWPNMDQAIKHWLHVLGFSGMAMCVSGIYVYRPADLYPSIYPEY